MKLNKWILTAWTVGSALAASAQDTNLTAPPPAALPATMAPAAATAAPEPETKPEAVKPKPKKPKAKKKNQVMALEAGSTAVAKDPVVNLRGQPSFSGEVVGHIKKGEMVTVYETITLGSHEKDEPQKWDRIALPTNLLVWVDAQFVDTATHAVKAKKLNGRGGPGENYSVVARLEKGAPVDEVKKEKGWIAIPAPTNAYAYVAAECLTFQAAPPAAPAPVAATPPPVVQVPVEAPAPAPAQPEPATPAPAAPPPVAPAPTAASQSEQELAALRKAEEATPAPTLATATAGTPAATTSDTAPRVVTREGFVHRAYNIQAPADYELHDIKTGELIDYLQPPAKMGFKIYLGTRVSIVGAEVIDPRWPRTPVLQVQSVDLMP
ncbi:MAG TPA: SH3 domain-containing protein [Verrucomicrobiae bacterium]|nr:SH3 domain-containing protein [Verrucomicrobiae bacterium]